MSPETNWPWHVLGLPGLPREEADIRRAYARALKKIDQAKDIEGFTVLRQAFETALAMRMGRSRQNEVRQERRAAALRAKEEAGVPEPPPAAEAPPQAPAEPPPPDPAQVAAQRREDAFQRLARLVELENLLTPYSARLMAALNHDLSSDPAYEGRVRALIVRSLHQMRRRDRAGEIDLASRLTPDLMQALDRRYGWLSDYAAFRRDFGLDPAFLDLLLDRGDVREPGKTAQPARKGFIAWLNEQGHGTHAGIVIGFILAIRWLIDAATRDAKPWENPWPAWVLVALFILPVAFVLFLVLRDMARFVWHAPGRLRRWVRNKRMRIEDWFALRRRRGRSK